MKLRTAGRLNYGKGYDTQQTQRRIDELATSLSTIREELVVLSLSGSWG
jgi:hypothetical protein